MPELSGVPRLLRDHAAYRRLMDIYPSDANAIEFCQGTFSEMRDDVYEAIRYSVRATRSCTCIFAMFPRLFPNSTKSSSTPDTWIWEGRCEYIARLDPGYLH